jgi:hypothetical protein
LDVAKFFVLEGNWQLLFCGGKKIRYDRKKKVPVVCLAGVSVFGSGRKLAFFCCGGKEICSSST